MILRLLKKDLILANRLYFELLSTKSVDDRRGEIENGIISRIEIITANSYSPGHLMMGLRYLSGEINEHVSITKDKFGEASLNIMMLIEVLSLNINNIEKFTYGKSYKFCIYIIARVFKILLMINTLHEDYLIEFEKDLNRLGKLISKSAYLMQTAINNMLDINWLLSCQLPKDIVVIHKEIRSQSFLK